MSPLRAFWAESGQVLVNRVTGHVSGNPTYQGLRQRECYNFRQALGANLAGRAFRLIDLCENKTEAGLHGNEFGLRSVVA